MNRSDKKRKTMARILALILVVGMVLLSLTYLAMAFGNSAALGNVAYAAEGDDIAQNRLDLLPDVLEYIHETYKDEISYEELVNAAYLGVFDSLDPFSEYYFASKGVEAISNALDSNYAGIGVTIQLNDDGDILITAITKNSPAEAAGMTAGGIITAIDGVSTKGLSLDDAATKMRGKAGTQVAVTVSYNGVPKTFTLTRAELVAPSLNYEMKDGIGYINLSSFSSGTAAEFRQARMELLAQGAKGFVLDLRNNTGGYLDAAIEISETLLDDGVICYLEQQGKIVETYSASPDDTKKVPIVLLTNGYTASASEILVMALTENGKAKTVGTSTYGKGYAQQVVTVVNGDSLKLSQFYFLGPKKTRITENGLAPDYVVNLSYEFDDKTLALINSALPLDLKARYFSGQYGLNVLAAQQRLYILGYDVDMTARMDEKTLDAIKDVQKNAGGKPYGGLDYFTLKALNSAYETAISGATEDLQLKKALELLK